MKNKMKNIVGQAVRNKDFWPRDDELADIWEAINNGSHLLLCAPRRVGKTSIMYNILDQPQPNYIAIYLDTESADSQYEFWSKLFNALLEDEFINRPQAKARLLWRKIKGINISKISAGGVEFGEGDVVDHKLAFKRLIKDLDDDTKLIIMLDEFAQTIENIIKYEDPKTAISLLKAHRELRQDVNFSQKVTFIYAGSIGLESVVAKIDASNHINDLNNIKVSPLSFAQARLFSKQLLASKSVAMHDDQIDYLLNKIEWLIPFYIQLMVQEIKKLCRQTPTVTESVVDEAINHALDNRSYFENWQSRLKTALDKKAYQFAKAVLNKISKINTLDSLDIANMAAKHSLDDDKARQCIQALIYDGYINNNDDVKVYRFNSPILRMWWNKNVAN